MHVGIIHRFLIRRAKPTARANIWNFLSWATAMVCQQYSHTKNHCIFFFQELQCNKTNLKQLGVFDAKIYQQKEDFQAASGLSRRHDLVPMALPVVFARVQVGNPPKKGQLNGPGVHKKMKQTPQKTKKRVEVQAFFFGFESFDVIHCSIWRFVLSELLWCHVTSKGGSARNPDVLANPPLHVSKRIVLWEMHCMPSSSAPIIYSSWTSQLLGWWPMEDPDFSWLWCIPPSQSLQALSAPWALWPPHRERTEGMLHCEMDHEDS